MYRPIKFRAWNNELKTMADCENIGGALGSLLIATNYQGIEDLIFMQYTGTDDKDGKEIFEGDVIEVKTYEDWRGTRLNERGKIVFAFGESRFVYQLHGYNYGITKKTVEEKEIKIIGNIYENPELLEVEK